MKQLFVASDAFVALNFKTSSAYDEAVGFVTGLFNETVKVYTSVGEVVKAADSIYKLGDNDKLQTFLKTLLGDSGIVVVDEQKSDMTLAIDLLCKLRHSINYSDAVMLTVMQRNGIKDIFSFNKDLKSGNVIVWPK
ncbi:type II toxin-antitoxin system VapC family toxin [candidate division WWE3 bacterium]|uniref:Type II toxin-antitoxin system VapC family toxin n=1 Tax=candidate division WWE3 bacterium TaxID=2053526 RepID=A0A955LL48_UNCKA|nr:type II toxin-antitoxin system VapC family toxin [candidate division WWE3 bacterium]